MWIKFFICCYFLLSYKILWINKSYLNPVLFLECLSLYSWCLFLPFLCCVMADGALNHVSKVTALRQVSAEYYGVLEQKWLCPMRLIVKFYHKSQWLFVTCSFFILQLEDKLELICAIPPGASRPNKGLIFFFNHFLNHKNTTDSLDCCFVFVF